MYNQNCYTNKSQAKLPSRFKKPTVQTEHQCQEKKPSYSEMLKRGLDKQKTIKNVPLKAARKNKTINQQANVCHRPGVLNTNAKHPATRQKKLDGFVQANTLNANKDHKIIKNVPLKDARKNQNINQHVSLLFKPEKITTHAKPLDTHQNKLDDFVQANNLNANANHLKRPNEMLEIEKQMEDLALTREQIKTDQSKEKNQNKFVSSLYGNKFEDVYKVGGKLGEGGQGSVYTGSLLQHQR